jgi:hypothetical protein
LMHLVFPIVLNANTIINNYSVKKEFKRRDFYGWRR